MQTFSEWKSGKNVTPVNSNTLQPYSEWKKTQPVVTSAPAPTVATPQPTLLQNIVQGTKDYANESVRITKEFPQRVLHPVDTFKKVADTMKNEWMAGVTKAGTPVQNGNVITDISNLITGFAQSAFSPITGLFKAAGHIPGIKQVADIINIPFAATGLGGSYISGKMVDWAPISQESKDIVKPYIQEVGSLAGQILLGGKIMSKLGEMSKKGETITPDIVKKVVVESQSELRNVDLTTPKTKQAKYAKSQGYEPYIPNEKLPTIEMGAKPKSTLPTIDISEPKPMIVKGDMTYEPLTMKEWIDAGKPTQPIIKSVPVEVKPVSPEIKIPKIEEPAKSVASIADTQFPSRVFERMKAEHPELEGELKYTPIKLTEDLNRAADLITKDKQKAFETAMGSKSSPDVTSTNVNIAMSEKALADGDIPLYSRLIKNRSLAQTRRGQEIVSERGSISDNSTSRYVKELINTRMDILGQGYLADVGEFVKKGSIKERATRAIDREVVKLEKKIKTKKLDVKTALELLDKLACV